MLKLTFFWHQLLLYYSGEPLGDIFVIWMMKQDQKWQPFFCQFLETKQTRHLFDDIRWDMTSLYYMFMSTYWISITLSCIKPIRTYTLQFYYAYTLTSALSKVISLTKGTQLCWAQRKRPSKSVRLPMYATSWCEVCKKIPVHCKVYQKSPEKCTRTPTRWLKVKLLKSSDLMHEKMISNL